MISALKSGKWFGLDPINFLLNIHKLGFNLGAHRALGGAFGKKLQNALNQHHSGAGYMKENLRGNVNLD